MEIEYIKTHYNRKREDFKITKLCQKFELKIQVLKHKFSSPRSVKFYCVIKKSYYIRK